MAGQTAETLGGDRRANVPTIALVYFVLEVVPSGLAALWMWRPWRRPRKFLAGAALALVLLALRIASRAPELTPDIPADDAQRYTFLAVVVFGGVGVAVWGAVVLLIARRLARPRAANAG